MNKTKNTINQTNAKGSELIMPDEDNWLSPPKRKKSKFMCAPFTLEEEQALAIKIKQGDEQALIELYQKNIPLVQCIAEDFFNNVFDNEEIFSEGKTGLLHACKLFDGTKGARFSTYASHWIKQKIRRYIATKARIVNTSQATYPKLCKFLRQKEELKNKFDREPSAQELQKYTKLPIIKVYQFLGVANYTECSTIASDKFHGSDDSENCFNEEILLSKELNPVEKICETDKFDEVREAMQTRFKDKPRTLEILSRLYGFNAHNKIETQVEISKDMNITRERVRQIEGIALKKLKLFLSEKHIKEELVNI